MSSNISIRPNRITITPKRAVKTCHSILDAKIDAYERSLTKQRYEENFSVERNSFIISKASKRKIFDSINFLYTLSKPKQVAMKNGGFIYNHRASFITLTLPSVQAHSDTQIKKDCLNQLLVELRKNYDVNNYVWKAELQKNSNIHFHIITDAYIDFQALRRRWNRILNKLNYVTNYQKKMQKLSFPEYHTMRNKISDVDYKKTSAAYKKGVGSNWSNPNSVDIKSISGARALGAYLAKYIAKDMDIDKIDEATLTRGKSFGRIWSRSSSLCLFDKLGSVCSDEWQDVLHYMSKGFKEVTTIIGDYFKAHYFNLDNLPNEISIPIYHFFLGMAKFRGYPLRT